MPKIALELKIKEIENLIEQLKEEEKLFILKKLEKQLWEKRFTQLINKFQRRFKKDPISEKKLKEIVEAVRIKRYETTKGYN
jgi:ribosomal protein L11 methylase PrmA